MWLEYCKSALLPAGLEYRYLKVNATLDAFGQNAAAEVITELIHEGCGQSGTSAYTMYFVTKQRQVNRNIPWR